MKRVYIAVILLIVFAWVLLQACTSGPSNDPSIQQTQLVLYVEQTIVARDIASLTQAAQNAPPVAPQPQGIPTSEVAQPVQPTQPNSSSSSFDEWVKNANVLLYEDIAGTSNRTRWIANALSELGVSYYDSLDQIGLFQSQLSSSQTWDLIIYARENRNNSAGNLFAEIFDEYDNGSSVIIEHWNLDDVANFSSALTSKMERCGFGITADLFDPQGRDYLLYAHNTQNPVHTQPHSNIRLTSYNTVKWSGDLGDLLRITSGGDGQILYGTSEGNSTSKGTVISCFGNRWILQTHATHDFERDRMIFLWENYIYNALYARYQFVK